MRLFDFILENMESILKEWENFARAKQPPGCDMNVVELRDHAEDMLRTVAEDMQSPQTKREQFEKSRGNKPKTGDTAAKTHAANRLEFGFSVNLLAAEYRALRASVLRLWLGQHDQHPEDMKDLIRFNEAIDQLLAEAVSRYSEIVTMDHVFLGILGHDLRTPLQSISQGAQYLTIANDADSKMGQLGTRIRNSVREMIDNLLDFTQSRIGGGIRITPTETDLAGIARQVVDELLFK